MALKPIPGYGSSKAGRGYSTYGGSTYALPRAATVPAANTSGLGGYAGYNLLNPALPNVPGSTTQPQLPRISTVGPLSVPSFQMELTSDPMYGDVVNAYNSAVQSGRNNLRDQIKQAVIRAGYDIRGKMPASLGDYSGDIDEATALAATQNPLSGRAQLQSALDRGMSDLAYNLAARGTGRSGAYASGAGALNEGFQQQSNEQMNALLDAISGGVGSYNQAANQAFAAKQSALEQIAARLAQRQGPTYDESSTPGAYYGDSLLQGLPPGVQMPDLFANAGPELAAWQAQIARQDAARQTAARAAAAPVRSPYYYGGGEPKAPPKKKR